ncbi:MAG: GntR family transcriptional regulator [Candidatus Ornithospirochaeta sp.]|nr:GntR family transcriptional regulator [Candidatus Ornithospirochaeta sp.]
MKDNKDRINVYKVIYDRIISGEYPSGYRLIEAELARELDVSRTPVRIAIERLVSEGLARHVPNKGATVRQLSFDDVIGLYQIREVNEGLAARLACRNADEHDAEALNRIISEMEATDDIDNYYRLCSEIHKYIFAMTKNEFLEEFIEKIYAITSRFHFAVLYMPHRTNSSKEEHKRIVEAILSKDEDRAEMTMKEHIRHNASFYQDRNIRSSLKALSNLNIE